MGLYLSRTHLHVARIQPISSVCKLNNLIGRVPNSCVIMNAQILQTLDQPPLHVPSLRSLHSCIDQTLTSSHRVEKELCGSQTGVETVSHEAFSFGFFGPLCKMRQWTTFKTIWNPFATKSLLPNWCHHLTDVDEGSFGSSEWHDQGTVRMRQIGFTGFSTLISNRG